MVDEQVAGADGRELLAVVEKRQRRPCDRKPVVDLQVGPVELRQLGGIGEVERAVDGVDVVVGDMKPLLDPLA